MSNNTLNLHMYLMIVAAVCLPVGLGVLVMGQEATWWRGVLLLLIAIVCVVVHSYLEAHYGKRMLEEFRKAEHDETEAFNED